MKRFEPIVVKCYSGYKGDESPRKFSMKGKEYVVSEVITRWYERDIDSKDPQWHLFKVLDSDKEEYVLRHNASCDTWEILW